MALIHEGIGQVLWDETHTYRQGDLVIMLPKAVNRRLDAERRKSLAWLEQALAGGAESNKARE